jgi:hypothetical protein
MTLIAEDLLLLLLDDRTGKPATSSLEVALGGALLAELALTGAIELSEKTAVWRSAKVRRGARLTLEDPVLASAFASVVEKERSAQALVTLLGKGLTSTLGERLAERGFLQRRDERVFGLFPRTRWPARDNSREQSLTRALTVVLVDGGRPDSRTAALVALLHAVGRAHKTVPHPGIGSGQVRKRAKQVAEGDWAAKAVKDAIAAAASASAGG